MNPFARLHCLACGHAPDGLITDFDAVTGFAVMRCVRCRVRLAWPELRASGRLLVRLQDPYPAPPVLTETLP